MESKALLSEIHADLTNWINELVFYKEEIKTFQKRLEEVVGQNNKPEILAEVEHFQNQFIRQNEVIDILKHDFKKIGKSIAAVAESNPVASDHRSVAVPAELSEQHDIFLKIYNELKSDFEKFLSHAF